jgi:SAM-dependent methyltransferase
MITDHQVAAIEAFGEKYPGHYMEKFFVDPRKWDREAEAIVDDLDIGVDMLDVLDIGCGFGYLVNAWTGRGCNAWGLDVGESCILEAVSKLKIPFKPFMIRAYEPMSQWFRGPYDLITMFGCTLRHGHPATSKDYWGWPAYRFFFEDVLSRLRPSGRFVIRPNVMGDEYGSAANLLARDTFLDKIGDLADIEFEGLQITLSRKAQHGC